MEVGFFHKKFNCSHANPQITSFEREKGEHSANSKLVLVKPKEKCTTHFLSENAGSNFGERNIFNSTRARSPDTNAYKYSTSQTDERRRVVNLLDLA